jgi:hypothetical protein
MSLTCRVSTILATLTLLQPRLTIPGAAYATSGETGKINKPIVGCISHGNDCFILGHIDGMSVIIGNMPRWR